MRVFNRSNLIHFSIPKDVEFDQCALLSQLPWLLHLMEKQGKFYREFLGVIDKTNPIGNIYTYDLEVDTPVEGKKDHINIYIQSWKKKTNVKLEQSTRKSMELSAFFHNIHFEITDTVVMFGNADLPTTTTTMAMENSQIDDLRQECRRWKGQHASIQKQHDLVVENHDQLEKEREKEHDRLVKEHEKEHDRLMKEHDRLVKEQHRLVKEHDRLMNEVNGANYRCTESEKSLSEKNNECVTIYEKYTTLKAEHVKSLKKVDELKHQVSQMQKSNKACKKMQKRLKKIQGTVDMSAIERALEISKVCLLDENADDIERALSLYSDIYKAFERQSTAHCMDEFVETLLSRSGPSRYSPEEVETRVLQEVFSPFILKYQRLDWEKKLIEWTMMVNDLDPKHVDAYIKTISTRWLRSCIHGGEETQEKIQAFMDQYAYHLAFSDRLSEWVHAVNWGIPAWKQHIQTPVTVGSADGGKVVEVMNVLDPSKYKKIYIPASTPGWQVACIAQKYTGTEDSFLLDANDREIPYNEPMTKQKVYMCWK